MSVPGLPAAGRQLSSLWLSQLSSLCVSRLFQGYLLLADSISKGMELGLSECQYQFRWERWDCSDRGLLQVVHSAETQGQWRPQSDSGCSGATGWGLLWGDGVGSSLLAPAVW